MPRFKHCFEVSAPLEAVADFHRDARALRRLTPPPMWAQFHRVEPLGEGSIAEFTLWLGPLPLRWLARHQGVSPLNGFTDVQERGPLLRWAHSHRFEAAGEGRTRVYDQVDFDHRAGWRGWGTRLLFSRAGLAFLFAYRAWATHRALRSS